MCWSNFVIEVWTRKKIDQIRIIVRWETERLFLYCVWTGVIGPNHGKPRGKRLKCRVLPQKPHRNCSGNISVHLFAVPCGEIPLVLL